MTQTVVFRGRASRWYAVAAWVVGAVVLSAFAVNGGVAEVVAYGALPVFLGVVGWALFWRPELRVETDGARVVNVVSTAWLPWSTITDVRTQWALELLTADRRLGAWAVPARGALPRWVRRSRPPATSAPAGADGAPIVAGGGDPEIAAALIRQRLTLPHDDGSRAPGSQGAGVDRQIAPAPVVLLTVSALLVVLTFLR